MGESLLEGLRLLPQGKICCHNVQGGMLQLIKAFAQVELLLPVLICGATSQQVGHCWLDYLYP